MWVDGITVEMSRSNGQLPSHLMGLGPLSSVNAIASSAVGVGADAQYVGVEHACMAFSFAMNDRAELKVKRVSKLIKVAR